MTTESFEEKIKSKSNKELMTLRKTIINNPSHPNRDEYIKLVDNAIAEIPAEELDEEDSNCKTEMPNEVKIACKFYRKWQNAISRNIEFTLSISDMRRLLSIKRCYYTGIVLQEEDGPAKKTLDRIDNTLGYTRENTVACSHAANRIKAITIESEDYQTSITIKQFKKMASKL